MFEQRSQLMLRANSLKKAVRQIIEHTEKGKFLFVLLFLFSCTETEILCLISSSVL